MSAKIDDSRAYLWKKKSRGFSTYFGNRRKSFYQRSDGGPLKPYKGGNNDWDRVKHDATNPLRLKNCQVTKNRGPSTGKKETDGGYYKTSVLINEDFDSLCGFMTKLTKLDTSSYGNFSRLFKFQYPYDQNYPIYIANPLYYWGQESNRYNGYGYYWNCYSRNGNNHVYVGGVYWPGEWCYLIINKKHGAKHHWAVVPSNASLSRYNHSTHDPDWDTSEWSDEGWGGGGKPEVY